MKVIEHHQEQLLGELLKWIVVLGAVAYIPSVVASLYEGLPLLAAIDTAGYLLLVVVFLYPGTSYLIRVTTAVAVTLLIGAAVLFHTGTTGAGHIWLLCAVFIAALFGRIAVIGTTIILTQIILYSYVILNFIGKIDHDATTMSLVVITANMLLISISLALVVHQLLKALNGEIKIQEKLLKLLQHRIMNNLQTIESLVSIQREQSTDIGPLSRRIRAVSLANGLLLSNPEKQSVDLAELVRLLSRAARVHYETGYQTAISAEKLTEVAVGFSDLLNILRDSAPFEITIGENITIRGSREFTVSPDRISQTGKNLIPASWTIGRRDDKTPDFIVVDMAAAL